MTPLHQLLGALLAKTERAKEHADRYAAELARTYLGDESLAKMGPPAIHGAEVEFELRFAIARAEPADAVLRQRLDGAAQRLARSAVEKTRREAARLGFLTRWSSAYGTLDRLLGSADLLRDVTAAIDEALAEQVHAARRSGRPPDVPETAQGVLSAIEGTMLSLEPVQWLATKRGEAFGKFHEGLRSDIERTLETLTPTLRTAATKGAEDELDVIVDAEALSRLPESAVSTVRLQFTLEEGEQAAFSSTIEEEG